MMKKLSLFLTIAILATSSILLFTQKTHAQVFNLNQPVPLPNDMQLYSGWADLGDVNGDGATEVIISGSFWYNQNLPSLLTMEPVFPSQINTPWTSTINYYQTLSGNNNGNNDGFVGLRAFDQNNDGHSDVRCFINENSWDSLGQYSRISHLYEMGGVNWLPNYNIINADPYLSVKNIDYKNWIDIDGDGVKETIGVRAQDFNSDFTNIVVYWDGDITQPIDSSTISIYSSWYKLQGFNVEENGLVSLSFSNNGPAISLYNLSGNSANLSFTLTQQIIWPSTTGAGISYIYYEDIDNDGDSDLLAIT